MAGTPTSVDPAEQLRELEQRLAATPRAARPVEHAALRYALGLAYAELPTGDRSMNLERALASYASAEGVFVADRFPLEHARVRIARGAALRELGRAEEALRAIEPAVELLSGAEPTPELGAALNNVGLAHSALGNHPEAIEALERATAALGSVPEARRQLPTALHNLAQAHAAAGDHGVAIDVYERGLAGTDVEEMPYQWALLHHGNGVSLTAIGEPRRAAEAFRASLRVFTRQRFPFQHALAKNNLGLAWAQVGDVAELRRAVAAFEDALGVLDPRIHRQMWQQAYRNLELAESALRDRGVLGSRAQNFASLLAGEPPEERLSLLRERLGTALALPEPQRSALLVEMDLATLELPEADARALSGAWLQILLELPNDMLVAGLRARLAAHARLPDEEARERADEVLERSLTEEMLAPQRIRVRDALEMLGYVRR